jgi:hypothetical protein
MHFAMFDGKAARFDAALLLHRHYCRRLAGRRSGLLESLFQLLYLLFSIPIGTIRILFDPTIIFSIWFFTCYGQCSLKARR